MPDFAKVEKKFRAKGVQFVGFNLEDEKAKAKIKETLKKAKVEFTNVYSEEKVMNKFPKFEAIPTTFFVDKDGKIVKSHTGSMSEAELTKVVESLVPKKGKVIRGSGY